MWLWGLVSNSACLGVSGLFRRWAAGWILMAGRGLGGVFVEGGGGDKIVSCSRLFL